MKFLLTMTAILPLLLACASKPASQVDVSGNKCQEVVSELGGPAKPRRVNCLCQYQEMDGRGAKECNEKATP